MGNMLSPTANMDACRRLINDLERIFELLSESDDCQAALLFEEEYCIKEFRESDEKLCLCVLYTLSVEACEQRSQDVQSLRSTVLKTCDMCMSLAGENYFTGGYEIKILKALNDEVREVMEVIESV